MVETYQFALPLVAAGQAQKHVTVNEALARLDALAQLRVTSAAVADPPAGAIDGQAYIVPAGGSWDAAPGTLALWANGGWSYVTPKVGWHAWSEAAGSALVFDGQGWQPGAVALTTGGAATVVEVRETTHVVSAGATSTVAAAIPGGSVVFGVSGRVTQAITGGATGWSLGPAANPNWYGSGLGVARNSMAAGLTGQPQAYYADTDLVLTAEGGSFAGGEVVLAVHLLRLVPPRAV